MRGYARRDEIRDKIHERPEMRKMRPDEMKCEMKQMVRERRKNKQAHVCAHMKRKINYSFSERYSPLSHA